MSVKQIAAADPAVVVVDVVVFTLRLPGAGVGAPRSNPMFGLVVVVFRRLLK